MIVRYEHMKFHYIESHWDYHQRGLCFHNGKLALFESHDETDYATMTNTCPCCKSNGSNDSKECHCENAPELYCYITELPFHKRIWYRMKPYVDLLWYIKTFQLKGIGYWNRWRY